MSSNLELGFSEFNLRMDKSLPHKVYGFEKFRFDSEHLMLYRSGEPVPIVPKAAETLLALIERRGEIVSKSELLERIWPDTFVEESNLFLYLSVLRKTLGNQKNGKPFVETLRRRGYRFNAEIQAIDDTYSDDVEKNNEHPDLSSQKVTTESGQIFVLKDWIDTKSEAGRYGAVAVARSLPALNKPSFEKEEENQQSFNEVAVSPSGERDARASKLVIIVGIGLIGLLAGSYFLFKSELRPAEKRIKTPSITSLTSGDDAHGPIISRDGKLIAYQTIDGDRQGLVIQQTGQLSPREILSSTTIGFGNKTFSPDGNYIYLAARERNEAELSVYRVPTFGGPLRRIIGGISDQSAVSFSPDGSEFVFARVNPQTKENSIVIAQVDGGSERTIASNKTDFLQWPAWSPDGKWIAYARYSVVGEPKDHFVSIEGVSPDGQSIKPLLNEKLDNCFRMSWTSSGDAIVFTGTKLGESMTARRDQIWLASLSTQELTRLSTEGIRYILGSLTDDDAAIVGTIDRTSQVWSIDANGDSRTATQLTRGKTDGRSGLAPLADGRVGYLMRNGDNWEIWVMNADGSDQNAIFDGYRVVDELRATPDGKYFIFEATVNENRNLFRIDRDGSNLKQLTQSDNGTVIDLSPSADSSGIVFTSQFPPNETSNGHVSLYWVSIDGGTPILLKEDGVFSPSNSPDGKYTSFVDLSSVPGKPRLVLSRMDDISEIRSFGTEQFPVLNSGAVWTPDGKDLAYAVHRGKTSNIWLQPVDGGQPRQLTDFSTGHIERFAYSADGKRIYMARGLSKNEALLIKGFLN